MIVGAIRAIGRVLLALIAVLSPTPRPVEGRWWAFELCASLAQSGCRAAASWRAVGGVGPAVAA